jgi:hypothetical protein
MDKTFRFEFEHLFRQWSAWFRLRRTTTWMLRGLIFGLALALGFSFASLTRTGLLKNEFLALVFRFTVLSTCLAALAGLVWPISKEYLALFYDQYFRLQERSRTALELLEQPKEIPSRSEELIENQLKDTLMVGSQVRPQSRFFVQISPTQVILIAVLTAGLVLTGIFGEPIFQRTLAQRQTRQALAQEAARLEALAEQIRSAEELSPEQAEEIAKTLEEAAQKIKDAQTTEQAVAVLSSTERQLRALENEQALQQAENLQNAGKRLLEDNPSGSIDTLQSFAQNLAEGDFIAAARDLANLDLSQLSTEETNSLAEQLEQTAQMLEESNPGLASQLAEAAQALKEGDIQAAQQALQEAAQALAETGQQIAQSSAASQAAAQASQGQERLIQAGTSQDQQAQGESVPQPGQGQGNQAQGEGQGSNEQSGNSSQGAGGGGAGEGESAGQAGQGPEAGVDPIGQNNQAGDGGLKNYEEIFAPQRLGGSGSEEVGLPGSEQPGGQVIGQGDTTPGDPNTSRVPYVDVLPGYAEAYRRAIESGQVPVPFRLLVREYFSSLEP